MDLIIAVVGILLGVMLGSWITYQAYQHKNPAVFIEQVEDLPEPISPYQIDKNKRSVVVGDE